ncbi:hypothetical protein N7465_004462 [Penicillium sp. CMV-2018d]|nr:hypothetical protein N7465_004462 [Penicillium sp. CMV-2018d]
MAQRQKIDIYRLSVARAPVWHILTHKPSTIRSHKVAQEIPRGGLGIGTTRSDLTILPMSVCRLTAVPGVELGFMGLEDDNGRRMAIRHSRVIYGSPIPYSLFFARRSSLVPA